MLEATPKNGGVANGGKRSAAGSTTELADTTPTLAQLGIDKKLSARAQKLAKLDEPAFEAAVSVAREVASQITASVILRQSSAAEPG